MGCIRGDFDMSSRIVYEGKHEPQHSVEEVEKQRDAAS